MKRLSEEEKAGLYITVIIHLAVIVVLLILQIGASLKGETSFVIDFSREEAIEKMVERQKEIDKQDAFDEEIARRIDDMISGKSGIEFKNVAVNRSSLKDDRGTNAEELYKDAQKLSDDLKNGIKLDPESDDVAEPSKPSENKKESDSVYSGPSVVSYSLNGRKASRLPIPAYRCIGGGMVTVIIIVNNKGDVIKARVQDEVSSPDNCLRNYAVNAALRSKFKADVNAPANQSGDIVYQFVAQ